MALRLFNSLTRRKENFTPRMPGQVRLYVCGPTVYDEPHLGHARSAVVFDVMARYLSVRGLQVTSVRNITDIDDKIIARAQHLNLNFRRLADHYRQCYQDALKRLNVRVPDYQPQVTDYIQPIQDAVRQLVQSGQAYQAGRDVYFAAACFPGYGKLSGRRVENLPQAEEGAPAAGKRHLADFALWKGAKPHEPSWPSPWGNGRPGWHIECSVMSASILGRVFDIHGGGTDLIFPHHENEIAQSEALYGQTPAGYWLHNGMLRIAGGKMSKSLGNALNLGECLDRYPPDAVRLFLLSKRYRHPLDYAPAALHTAVKHAMRLQQAMAGAPPAAAACRSALWSRFCTAMDDDFNFPMALAAVFAAVRAINRCSGGIPGAKAREGTGAAHTALADLGFVCSEILGLRLEAEAARRARPVAHAAAAVPA
jgi:cysteinyl-tRNA synthetase